LRASDYLDVIRARKWVVVWVAVVATIGAVAVSMLQPAMYGATAVLLYLQSNTGTAILGTPQSNAYQSSDVGIATQVGLIEQPPIAQKAIDGLGLHVTAEALLKQLTVSGDGQTMMITIAAVDRTPTGAAAIANAMAGAYSKWSQEGNRRSITAAVEETQLSLGDTARKIAALEATMAIRPSSATQVELQATRDLYGTLLVQLQKLESADKLETGSVRLVTAAVPDPVPVSPQPARNGLLGLVAGLVLGLAAALLANALDNTVKSPDEAAALYCVPVVGQIPVDEYRKDELPRVAVLTHPDGAAAEAYRGLRNSFQFVDFERSIKVLMVTSAVPGEGKSTVAANLSVVLAQAGWKIVLVVADFRRSGAADLLGLPNSPGLSEILAGKAEITSAVHKHHTGLRVIGSGEMPPNPSELLGSASMERMLAQMGESADLIIIDTPPLLAVADAAVIARWADAALVVTRERATTREAARSARAQIDAVGGRLIGVVVTGIAESASDRSGYRLYSGYGRS
jgi:capsular exopolysaccharide synthesis family protein